MKLTYYKNLDGVRAIAALMIMVFHFFGGIVPNSTTLKFLTKISIFGQTGVTLFFVLSGFLITRILLESKGSHNYFKNFYLRRALRIFPLYYLFLFLYYYLVPYFIGPQEPDFSNKIYYFTYLQNFAETFNWNVNGPEHFWSLAVEEHFYLFWPFIVYLFSNKNLTKIIIGIVIGAMLLRTFMINNGYEVFYFTFTRFDSLAIGAFLAILEQQNFLQEKNSKLFLFLLIGLFVPTVAMWIFFTGEANKYIQIFKFLFLSSIYFSIIAYLLCIKGDSPLNKILKTKFFSYTGKISYGLYVYHPLVYSICKRFLDSRYIEVNFFIRIIFTYLIAALSYHFFESSFLKMKKYFEYNKKSTLSKIRVSA